MKIDTSTRFNSNPTQLCLFFGGIDGCFAYNLAECSQTCRVFVRLFVAHVSQGNGRRVGYVQFRTVQIVPTDNGPTSKHAGRAHVALCGRRGGLRHQFSILRRPPIRCCYVPRGLTGTITTIPDPGTITIQSTELLGDSACARRKYRPAPAQCQKRPLLYYKRTRGSWVFRARERRASGAVFRARLTLLV